MFPGSSQFYKNMSYVLHLAKEMVQWVQCLLCKDEDLSWDPLHPYNPRTRRKKQEGPRNSCQPVSLGSMREHVSTMEQKAIEKDTGW